MSRPMSDASSDPAFESARRGQVSAVGASVGDRVGSYRLRPWGAAGATGRLFEVEHVTTGRRATMKVLSPKGAVGRGSGRSMTEASAFNALDNPHMATVIEVIPADGAGGVEAIVTEL